MKPWWVCLCGRKLYEHATRGKVGGGREYVCALLPSGRFESGDQEHDYDPERGLTAK